VSPLQRLLEGMPTPRPPLVVQEKDGWCVVVAGPVVVFGPYQVGDLGMRNLGVVTLTQLGFAVGAVAAAFGIQPGYASTLRGRFREHGSAGLVKVSGRTPVLTAAVVATARGLLDEGWSRGQVAGRLRVSPSALSKALSRHRAPAQTELEVCAGQPPLEQGCPDGARDAASASGTGTVDDLTSPGTTAHDADTTEEIVDDTADRADETAPQGQTPPQGEAVSGAMARIARGVFPTRYAGAMLAYAYLDRIGACAVLAGLPPAPWRRFDQAQIACHTLLALLLGVGSIEAVKTLQRAQAGPLTGATTSPELHTLRPRLAAIADQADVLVLQRTLAAAMLALAGESAGIFYVDDHFVPYNGAKPVAMGHNGKKEALLPWMWMSGVWYGRVPAGWGARA
jgi:hypothetical protein